MQLETFQVFYDLAQTHSLTATARHLHLTGKAARISLCSRPNLG
jgi:DNA-binding transcriptional LysR family regulator